MGMNDREKKITTGVLNKLTGTNASKNSIIRILGGPEKAAPAIQKLQEAIKEAIRIATEDPEATSETTWAPITQAISSCEEIPQEIGTELLGFIARLRASIAELVNARRPSQVAAIVTEALETVKGQVLEAMQAMENHGFLGRLSNEEIGRAVGQTVKALLDRHDGIRMDSPAPDLGTELAIATSRNYELKSAYQPQCPDAETEKKKLPPKRRVAERAVEIFTTLPLRSAAILYLSVFQELSTPAIAGVLRTTKEEVAPIVREGKKTFREIVQKTIPGEERKISHQTLNNLAYFARQAILLQFKRDKAKHGSLKFLLENPARFTTTNIDPNLLLKS